MSHTSREKLDFVNRTKKIIGQLEPVLKGLNDDVLDPFDAGGIRHRRDYLIVRRSMT